MLVYLMLFLASFLEESISIFYYKLVQRHRIVLCSLVSFVRTLIWGFVIFNIIDVMLHNTNLGEFIRRITAYALGASFGDYISLSVEPFLDKHILKIQRKGRKNRWWFIFGDRKK